MADTNTNSMPKRLAVVTGANKGIGFEICRQLASYGVTVVLTARDEKRGIEAVEKLKGSGLSNVVFHQLDVKDPASTVSLADFIKTQFGILDILVNNAGVTGFKLDDNAYKALMAANDAEPRTAKILELAWQTYETAEECIQANYYGTKRYIPLASAKEVLGDVEALTEKRVGMVLDKYLKDFTDSQGASAYNMSKASMNAYTRILAKKFPTFCINCVAPGYVKTDLNYNTGHFTVEEGAAGPAKLALLPDDGPSGLFFFQKQVSTFD